MNWVLTLVFSTLIYLYYLPVCMTLYFSHASNYQAVLLYLEKNSFWKKIINIVQESVRWGGWGRGEGGHRPQGLGDAGKVVMTYQDADDT